jgi:dTDP-4-dehydrorhamnose 3,5-epimerase
MKSVLLTTELKLRRIDTPLPGVWLIQPEVFRDTRGFFLETYHQVKFAELGITDQFVQDNHSCSSKGVLRGLHYQLRHAQAKLCRVVEGEVIDVVVDIRVGSPYFGKSISALLSAERNNQLYVPPGFAHGFLVLSERAQFLYKCSDFYDPTDEYGIIWNDPDLSINWGVNNPILSDKDQRYLPLSRIPRERLPRYA